MARQTSTSSRRPGKTAALPVRLTPAEKRALQARAREAGVTASDLVRAALACAGLVPEGDVDLGVLGAERLDLERPAQTLRLFAGLTLAEAGAKLARAQRRRRCAPTTVHGPERTGPGVSVRKLCERAQAFGLTLEIRVRK
jgi:hypothetical protein